MLKETISIDDAIALLNEALVADADAVRRLLAARVPCNQKMAEHPTIQCASPGELGGPPDTHTVGALGLINGLFGVDETGFGAIAAVVLTDHDISEEMAQRRAEKGLKAGDVIGFRRAEPGR